MSMNVSANRSGSAASMMAGAMGKSKIIFSSKKPLVSMAESLESQPSKRQPKPEIFTDRQIIKRLNLEVN